MSSSRRFSVSIACTLVPLALAAACGDDETSGGSGGAGANGGAGGTTGGAGGGGAGGGGAGGIGQGYDCSPAEGALPELALTPVAQGLFQPILAKSPPGDPTRLFIAQKDGVVRLVQDGTLLPTPFIDISELVATGGGNDERGLLGMAFHPDYEENGRFFLFYTNAMENPDGRVAEFRRSMADPNVADTAPPAVVIDIPEPAGNHNGGALEFSPVDGHLYIGVGDGGGADDTFCNGQNLSTLLASVLRLDVDQSPYAPMGNYPGAPPEVHDKGLRNPWRISFDACTGDLYIGDVGQGAWEEIDVEAPGQGHKNYGWPAEEGTACFDNPEGCPGVPACGDPGFTRPIAEYSHGAGCSVSGGYVYRGAAIPGLRGYYLYGDFCSGRTWALKWEGGSLIEPPVEITDNLGTDGMSISSFGQDASGETYLCDLTGTVYRIDAE